MLTQRQEPNQATVRTRKSSKQQKWRLRMHQRLQSVRATPRRDLPRILKDRSAGSPLRQTNISVQFWVWQHFHQEIHQWKHKYQWRPRDTAAETKARKEITEETTQGKEVSREITEGYHTPREDQSSQIDGCTHKKHVQIQKEEKRKKRVANSVRHDKHPRPTTDFLKHAEKRINAAHKACPDSRWPIWPGTS